MNHSLGAERFLKTCDVLGEKFKVVVQFSSNHEVSHIVASVVASFTTLLAVFINCIALLTFWKSSQLRNKLPNFTILVLAAADTLFELVAGLLISCLISEITGSYTCVICSNFRRFGSTCLAFSKAVSITVNFVVYSSIVHPYFYKTKMTKAVFCKFIIFNTILSLAALGFSFLHKMVMEICVGATIIFYIATTIYFYARIFHSATLSRRRRESNDSSTEQKLEKQSYLQKMKLAKSCFIIVICSLIFNLPIIISSVGVFAEVKEKFDVSVVFRSCATIIALISPIINSLVFFWRKRLLRVEAKNVLKDVFCKKTEENTTNLGTSGTAPTAEMEV